jgi:hypothetical protein
MLAGGCEGAAAAISVAVRAGSVGIGTEDCACWIDGYVEGGGVGEGEAMSAGRLQMKIASATIKMTNQGLRGSIYFIALLCHRAWR